MQLFRTAASIFLLFFACVSFISLPKELHSVDTLSCARIELVYQAKMVKTLSTPALCLVLFQTFVIFVTSKKTLPDLDNNSDTVSVETTSPLALLPHWLLYLLAFSCLALCATVAGLTLGMMSLDNTGLEILANSVSSTSEDREAAQKVMPLRENGNMLLVVLLLGTTVSTEFLPLILETLYPTGYFALITSVVGIMLFGEIIPQAVCSRNALQISAFFVPFVKILQFIMYPVAKPIALALDFFLGQEEDTVYDKHQLKALIDVHGPKMHGAITGDERSILKGTLDFATKTVDKVLTKADDVFMLELDQIIDKLILEEVLHTGYSRIPIYATKRSSVICLVLSKELIGLDYRKSISVREFLHTRATSKRIRSPLICSKATILSDLLNEFQIGRTHMAIVYDDICLPESQRRFLGIVTLEDIIEEILQEEIVDETDVYLDNRTKIPVFVKGPSGEMIRTSAPAVSAVKLPGTKSIILKEINYRELKAPMAQKLTTPSAVQPGHISRGYSKALDDLYNFKTERDMQEYQRFKSLRLDRESLHRAIQNESTPLLKK